MLIFLGVILLPMGIAALILFFIGRQKELPTVEDEKWHLDQQKVRTQKAKDKISKNQQAVEQIIIKRQQEANEITETNEEALKIINNIKNAKSSEDRDKIREQINNLKK
jgi:hypothetical protein